MLLDLRLLLDVAAPAPAPPAAAGGGSYDGSGAWRPLRRGDGIPVSWLWATGALSDDEFLALTDIGAVTQLSPGSRRIRHPDEV